MIRYDPHRWLDHFFDIRGSLIREVSGRVLLCVAWSAAVVWFHTRVAPVGVSPVAHSLVGVALGLLLVFRTNSLMTGSGRDASSGEASSMRPATWCVWRMCT